MCEVLDRLTGYIGLKLRFHSRLGFVCGRLTMKAINLRLME